MESHSWEKKRSKGPAKRWSSPYKWRTSEKTMRLESRQRQKAQTIKAKKNCQMAKSGNLWQTNITIENYTIYSGFTHWNWWFSIVVPLDSKHCYVRFPVCHRSWPGRTMPIRGATFLRNLRKSNKIAAERCGRSRSVGFSNLCPYTYIYNYIYILIIYITIYILNIYIYITIIYIYCIYNYIYIRIHTYHTLPYHTLPYPTLPYLTLPYHCIT